MRLNPSIARRLVATGALAILVALACQPMRAQAQTQTPTQGQVSTEHAPGRTYFSPQEKFVAANGAEVYELVCQGCHMPGGKGAVGGGKYPALAANKNLSSATYLTYTVVNGRKGMPPFGNSLTDAQIADVVNYLRSHFGNAYSDVVSAADVKAARPAAVAAAPSR